MSEQVTVIKLSAAGREVWRWQGRLLARGTTWVQIEARFNAGTKDLGYVTLCPGDRFVEWYYTDRWYNIFEIHGDTLKGWYCNIARPAQIDGDVICHEDLALDLFVYPDGRTVPDDEDEFEALALDDAERAAALDAVQTLRKMAAARRPPFVTLRTGFYNPYRQR
ncbi:MAG: DUF402 domain-containing protein [Anaerolineae bacterium]|nr:DUF402 domain-containing protein [Anaerolineae bacterium]